MDLNIVTLNIPFPPDYGGMIDSYYRIKWLTDAGVRIHLHCFEYGLPHSSELESQCETVTYYCRNTDFRNHFSFIPYIVESRKSSLLLHNLKDNNFPILFDGLHTTFYLNHPDLKNRKRLVRAHNIEHLYYKSLAINEPNLTKKTYYLIEYYKLKYYEKELGGSDFTLAISNSDVEYFRNKFNNALFSAPFHPFEKIVSIKGKGGYILYHGDLSVNENSIVAESLISNVFSRIHFRCIIAGKNPSAKLISKAIQRSNIKIISNPDDDEMAILIKEAHINILPSLTNNGFKMKLLLALYSGRHCLVNKTAAMNFEDHGLFNIADSPEQNIKMIHILMQEDFTEEMINVRNKLLIDNYSNRTNASNLVNMIFIS